MKYSKLFLILMMILSLFSGAFVGKESIKRFLPASLFMAIIVKVVNVIAKKGNGGGGIKKFILPFQANSLLCGDLSL